VHCADETYFLCSFFILSKDDLLRFDEFFFNLNSKLHFKYSFDNRQYAMEIVVIHSDDPDHAWLNNKGLIGGTVRCNDFPFKVLIILSFLLQSVDLMLRFESFPESVSCGHVQFT